MLLPPSSSEMKWSTSCLPGSFGIPYLLLVIGIVLGRSSLGLYLKMKEAPTKLEAKEVLAILWQLLKGSFIYALLVAFLLFCFYDSQRPDNFISTLELVLVGIGVCLGVIWSLFQAIKLIRWLLRVGASQRQVHHQQTHQRAEEPPLQVHRRP